VQTFYTYATLTVSVAWMEVPVPFEKERVLPSVPTVTEASSATVTEEPPEVVIAVIRAFASVASPS